MIPDTRGDSCAFRLSTCNPKIGVLMASKRDGFLPPFESLTMAEMLEVERFARLTGIGPLFDWRPRHHGQHSWCCELCNQFRVKRQRRVVRQPWELRDAA